MSNILSTGVSGLVTNRQGMDTAGHNIANVNTEGYNRQRVDFSTREANLSGSHFIGNGVETAQIRRSYDNYLANEVRSNQTAASEMGAYFNGARQLNDLVADSNMGLQPAVQGFFDSVQGLADDPASTVARQLMLSKAQAMVDRFQFIDSQFNRSIQYTNDQTTNTVRDINDIASNIAIYNEKVVRAAGATTASIPNDLLDQRDKLIDDLSKLVDVNVVPQSDGALNVFIGKGQALVMSNTTATLDTVTSNLDASRLEIVLSYPYGTLNISDQLSGGQLSGLVRYRDEILDPVRSQFGLVALGLATDMNQQHQLGIDMDGLAGASLFSTGSMQVLEPPGNGSSVTVDYASINDLTGSDYKLEYDGTDFILTQLSSNARTILPTGNSVVDGMTIDIDATGAVPGDRFLIQPTSNAASSINLLINDINKLAAAGPLQSRPDVDVSGNPANTGNAKVSLPSVTNANGLPLGATPMELVFGNDPFGTGPGFTILNGPAAFPDNFLPYDPATESAGKTFPTSANPTQFDAFGGMSFSISGTPQELVAGAGDRFFISDNTSGTSDNRNALRLAEFKGMEGMLGGTASYEEVYSKMVSHIGAKTHQAEVNLTAQEGLLERSRMAFDEVTGVNLDEEAAKLIQFQQAYQASAQVISIAKTLFDSLLSAVRR